MFSAWAIGADLVVDDIGYVALFLAGDEAK